MAAGWSEPREMHIRAFQPARPEQFHDLLVSPSWIATLPAPGELLAKVDELVGAGQNARRDPGASRSPGMITYHPQPSNPAARRCSAQLRQSVGTIRTTAG